MLFEVVVPGSDPTSKGVSPSQAAERMLEKASAAEPAENAPDSERPENPALPEPVAEGDEGSLNESDGDAELDGDPAEEPDAGPDTERKYRVKENGQEYEVTLDELLNGYSRTADYTRKTQATAEERKRLEAEITQTAQERTRYAEALKQYEEMIKAQTPKEPDWTALQREDPDRFREEWPVWQYHKEQMRALAEERRAAEAKVAEDRQREHAMRVQREVAKTLELVPEWKDEAKRTTEQRAILDWALRQGFAPEEIVAADADHRIALLLRKAHAYDALQQKKPEAKRVIEQVKTARPGPAKSPRAPTTEATKARQRLAKTGSIHDAARLIELRG